MFWGKFFLVVKNENEVLGARDRAKTEEREPTHQVQFTPISPADTHTMGSTEKEAGEEATDSRRSPG